MTANELYTTMNDVTLADYTTCKTREEYLDWIVQWRAQYKALTLAIRQLKPMRKSTGPIYDENAAWIKMELREKASRMMMVRTDAKEWSIAQKAVKLEEEAA